METEKLVPAVHDVEVIGPLAPFWSEIHGHCPSSSASAVTLSTL